MKKFLVFLCGILLILGTAGIAGAYQFDMGDDSWVDTSGTNGALIMYATVNPDLDDEIFTLTEGESHSFLFATIGTNESWINRDDLNPGSMIAYVDFDNPELVEAIGGTSIGFTAFFGFAQGWHLTWADPDPVEFGDGGEFAITLSDVGYGSILWQGPDGSANVYAEVTLTQAPVPEPATMLLLGSGLVGLAAVGRRKFFKK